MIIVAVVLAVIVAGVAWWLRHHRKPSTIAEACVECAMANPNTGGPELRGRQVHEVITVPRDDVERQFVGMGGTYTAVCYCRKHCPGGCENQRCRRARLMA